MQKQKLGDVSLLSKTIDIGYLECGLLLTLRKDGGLYISDCRVEPLELGEQWVEATERSVLHLVDAHRLICGANNKLHIQFVDGTISKCNWCEDPTSNWLIEDFLPPGILSKDCEILGLTKNQIRFVSPTGEICCLEKDKTKWVTTTLGVWRGWEKFTRVFCGYGAAFAESPTGEGVWFNESQLFTALGDTLFDEIGYPILNAGFRSFTSICPISDSRFLGLNDSGALFQFSLTDANDSLGFSAKACHGSILAYGICTSSISGYCWPNSANSGELVSLFVSSQNEYQVSFLDLVSETPLTSPEGFDDWKFSKNIQRSIPRKSGDAGWKSTIEFRVPDCWPSTIANLTLKTKCGDTFDIPFVIIKEERPSKNVLTVVASTNTWTAYNSWGGVSKYGPTYSKELSAKRPNLSISPYWDGHPNHLLVSDLWILRTLRAMGYEFCIITDTSLHRGQSKLSENSPIVLLTHPEYWSKKMLKALMDFINASGSIVYLGGNGVFELCDVSEAGETVTFFPNSDPPHRAPGYLRNLSPPMPEREFLGVGFKYDIDWKANPNTHLAGSYTIREPNHWVFEGLKLKKGDLIGHQGRNGGGACGWEMDSSQPGDKDLVGTVEAKWDSDRGAPPDNITILAQGFQQDGDRFGGDMTIYSTQAAGLVFSVGSICFGGSFVDDERLQTIVENVINRTLNGA